MNTTNGKEHDFSLFKNSKLAIKKDIQVKVDLGYQVIKKLHKNSAIPKKSSKNYNYTLDKNKRN